MTVLIIFIFLSGNIISIPKGTREGGIISSIGTVVIIITMISTAYIYRLFIPNKKSK
ncbi:MAG: hypothetical protein PSN34_08765 [Urechidicola sp.]|nr:hypothetical protein [Urechidicola sp.]